MGFPRLHKRSAEAGVPLGRDAPWPSFPDCLAAQGEADPTEGAGQTPKPSDRVVFHGGKVSPPCLVPRSTEKLQRLDEGFALN